MTAVKEIGKIQALMIPGTVMPSPLKCWFRAPSQARLSSDDLISGDVAKQERERERSSTMLPRLRRMKGSLAGPDKVQEKGVIHKCKQRAEDQPQSKAILRTR